MKLSMAYSPCPNDTFMFHDVARGGLRQAGYDVKVHLHDIETLNRMALAGAFDLTKISFHAYLLVRREYELLNAGAALGDGCGPLVVARHALTRRQLRLARVAVPGELTTAHLLFRLWAPRVKEKRFVPYDQVIGQVAGGKADCGVIIHEGRFTYERAGLVCLADLGQWWQQRTSLPIPLGCIVARRSLGRTHIRRLEQLLRQAIQHSLAEPQGTRRYVRRHAKEMDGAVLDQHVKLFVNEFSLHLGRRGRAAVARLEQMADLAGGLA